MAKPQNTSESFEEAMEQVEKPQNWKVEQKARRTRAVSLALAGLTYEQIGDELGISASGAYDLVQRTLESTRNYAVDQLRELENARLDRATAAIWSQVIEGDLRAVNAYLRISDRRAKLNGLDAPTKVQMSVTLKQEMEQALQSLEAVILEGEVVSEEDVIANEERKALEHTYEGAEQVEDKFDGAEIVDPLEEEQS